MAQVLAFSTGENMPLIDARSAAQFAGTERRSRRAGRIPGDVRIRLSVSVYS